MPAQANLQVNGKNVPDWSNYTVETANLNTNDFKGLGWQAGMHYYACNNPGKGYSLYKKPTNLQQAKCQLLYIKDTLNSLNTKPISGAAAAVPAANGDGNGAEARTGNGGNAGNGAANGNAGNAGNAGAANGNGGNANGNGSANGASPTPAPPAARSASARLPTVFEENEENETESKKGGRRKHKTSKRRNARKTYKKQNKKTKTSKRRHFNKKAKSSKRR